MVQLKCLLKHESCLRHRSFRRVHKQENPVHHFEYTLDLAAEIGVSGGVDDVYLYVIIVYRGVLRKYGYPALALEGVAVHDALLGRLIFAVYSALLEHLVDKRRLSVVDVRDDCDVS